jgi:germination protein M
MRPQVPALAASAVVAAGTFYLAHVNGEQQAHRQHQQHYAQSTVVPDITSMPLTQATGSPAAPDSRPQADVVTVYYCRPDGQILVPWRMRLGAAHDVESVAYLAAVKAVHGPADTLRSIRFPAGTTVRRVSVEGDIATVDLSDIVAHGEAGSVTELGEFKALVWTLTDLPTIRRVQIRVGGAIVPTLPGGHLELDEPLSRSDF